MLSGFKIANMKLPKYPLASNAKLKKRKTPIVRVDESLNQFNNQILFSEKLGKANKNLDRIGLPKQWLKDKTVV